MRYARACRADGRYELPDVAEAIQIKMALVISGGYPARERHLAEAVRQQVFTRAHGLCAQCGSRGTDVDHIQGDSNDLVNLQLLCRPCHNRKSVSCLTLISSASHPKEWAHLQRLRMRISAKTPTRFCDSPEWGSLWRTVQRERNIAAKSAGA